MYDSIRNTLYIHHPVCNEGTLPALSVSSDISQRNKALWEIDMCWTMVTDDWRLAMMKRTSEGQP